MQVFRGSSQVVKAPKIIVGEFTKDFGNGFYCTKYQPQAENGQKSLIAGL